MPKFKYMSFSNFKNINKLIMKYLVVLLLAFSTYSYCQDSNSVKKSIRIVEELYKNEVPWLGVSNILNISLDSVTSKLDFKTKLTMNNGYYSERVRSVYLDDITNESIVVYILDIGGLQGGYEEKYSINFDVIIKENNIKITSEKFDKKKFPTPVGGTEYSNKFNLNNLNSVSFSIVKKFIENIINIFGVPVHQYYLYNAEKEDYILIFDPFSD